MQSTWVRQFFFCTYGRVTIYLSTRVSSVFKVSKIKMPIEASCKKKKKRVRDSKNEKFWENPTRLYVMRNKLRLGVN